MRPGRKWFAALAVSTLCTLVFVAHPPDAVSGDSYFLVKAGAYTPQASDMDNYSTGPTPNSRRALLPAVFIRRIGGRLLRIQRRWE